MPWCEECAKYWTPSAMNPDGTCPTCGRVVEVPKLQSTETEATGGDPEKVEKAPWHFKLLVAALVVYLVWRLIQLFV